jgi:hypothetical protein
MERKPALSKDEVQDDAIGIPIGHILADRIFHPKKIS